ncbi:hypothetical protein AGR7A_pAt20235 [Agrobacterium deltaense NCPPB 1641]|uniref:Uncharacterized protein n=1 Tax=Agrobacterium deltaense NCPPB 1641 TaxID=1183425 RepID=A0A1S7UA62_9HYPH|nr:hypothetical protein AGR7A_pAt20235 [Agrobacterium deltaense NCPPB 1641]
MICPFLDGSAAQPAHESRSDKERLNFEGERCLPDSADKDVVRGAGNGPVLTRDDTDSRRKPAHRLSKALGFLVYERHPCSLFSTKIDDYLHSVGEKFLDTHG